jgi:hypothetical protein
MNMGGELQAVFEADPKMLPPDHPSNPKDHRQRDGRALPRSERPLPKVEPISPVELKALEGKTIVIDVMMLQRPGAHAEHLLALSFIVVTRCLRRTS